MPVVGVAWDPPPGLVLEGGVERPRHDLYARFREVDGERVLLGGVLRGRARALGDGAVALGELMTRLLPGLLGDEQLEPRAGDERASLGADQFGDQDVGVNDQLHALW